MGKPKKGKKGRKEDDFSDDDGDIDILNDVDKGADVAQTDAKAPTQPKKAKKSKKKKDDDWEDDVSAEIAALSLQQNQPESEDESDRVKITQSKAKKKDKKKKKVDSDDDGEEMPAQQKSKKGAAVSAFMMLDVDEPSEEEMESDEEQKISQSAKTVKTNAEKKELISNEVEDEGDDMENKQPQQQKGKKKKGKQKNKQQEEEEDFDAILAQFGAPPEKTEPSDSKAGKKKKKGKKQDSVEEAPPQVVEEEEGGIDIVKDISDMTEEELMKHMGLDDEEDDKKKRKKGKKQKELSVEEATEADDGEGKDDEDGEESTVKSAAQKKKEKRERQKQKKLEEAARKKTGDQEPETEKGEAAADAASNEAVPEKSTDEPGAQEDGEIGEGESKKKKKDRKKKGKEPEEEKKKKPSKMALALQEMLKKQKDEEERLIREEDEKERLLEEKMRIKEEKELIEREKKDKEKQKKKEKIERLKAEGKYMTAKQKESQKIAQAKLEALRAQGIDIPSVDKMQEGEKKKRVVYDSRPKKKKLQAKQEETEEQVEVSPPDTPTVEVEVKEAVPETLEVVESLDAAPEEEVKDEWDASSEEEEETDEPEEVAKAVPAVSVKKQASVDEEDDEEDEDEEDSDDEDESEEDDSSDESDSDDGLSAKERARERGLARIQKRKDDADSKKTTDVLRAPVVVVLGHVDTGKTKILDKLRRTNVQDGEAGGITQQIGATNVPEYTIKDQTKMCKDFVKKELKIPGLLIIDTPGHESFSNLRSRGSSLCDIAILVIDIMHGLEPQTIESINLLKSRKTPFLVALNKIDRLFGWQPNPHSDVVNTIKKQKQNTKLEFEERAQQAIVQLAEQGLNAALFYENKNPREYISLVPTSAHSGDGMGNLIALVCELSQSMLAKQLAFSELLAATVMEVKALPGLGTTIDVILVNGSIREGATVVVAGQEGPIVTQIRGLLLPQPLKELRVKGAYEHKKEVVAAQGVKIIAKDLDKALAGLPLFIAHHDDELEIYREDLSEMLEDILGSIKLSDRGVFVQASTLGSLEALLEFLRTSKIPYAGINIGPVHKRDIMKASVMLEHDSQYAVILAFDVKVEREAQEMAESLGVNIFTADIIYHLFDAFMAYRDTLKKKKQEEFKHVAVFPCKIRVLPQYIFNSRDPIVCGVIIEAGFLKIGSPLCVPSKEFVDLGRVTSIEINHKPVEKALKGQEVCIKIEPLPSETPKMFGRHFEHTDTVCTKISRESIDAVKNYFREDMGKGDWQVMIEMKKLFEII